MKKRIIVALISFSASQLAFAQSNQLNSLKKQLTVAKSDTNRVLLLATLVGYYVHVTPDSAFKYGSRGLKLAEKIGYVKGETIMLTRMGLLYRETGNLPNALDLGLKALELSRKNDFPEVEEHVLILIGTIYHDLGDYHKSNSFYQQSKVINEKLKNQSGVYYDVLDMVSNYIELGNTDSATYYLKKADNVYAKGDDKTPISGDTYMWRNMGRLQFKLGNYNSALYDLKRALLLSLNKQDHRNASYNYSQLAEVFAKINKTDSVIFYSKLGIQEGEVGPYSLFILKNSAQLVKAFKLKNDFKNALYYTDLAEKTKESLFGAGNIQAINKLITDENRRKKEAEDQKIAYENQVKQYALSAGAIVALFIIFFLYRINRQKHSANTVLQKTLTELKQTQTQLIQSEKMASLGELTAGIAHEIQNPLNFVNNFSEVNREMVEELEEELRNGNVEEALAIAADIKGNEEKINHHGKRADFIVKGMLEHSRTSTGERQPTNINVLADEFLKLSYHGLRAKDKNFNAELITNFDETLPKVNVVQQDMGRVLLNLFNNAFYAVNQRAKISSEGFKPTVGVSSALQNGQVIITVKDNGNGIPDAIKDKIMQPFFTTKPAGEGTGLGLSLSYDIVVKGHGGSMQLNSNENEGAEFIIKLPLNTI